jgi:endonuclease G
LGKKFARFLALFPTRRIEMPGHPFHPRILILESRTMKRLVLSVAVWLGFVAVGLGQASVSQHLTMGNPSGAKPEATDKENFLMVKRQFVLSYNDKLGTANWVSWRLSKSDLGDEDRANTFRADTALPDGFFRANKKSYVGSGFDRGHLCPSGDRTKSFEDNTETFLMTNMMPQAPNNNQKTWMFLEKYSRSLAMKGNELYIVAGPNGAGGRGKNGFRKKIADGKVTVPNMTWKVILVLRNQSGDDVARVNEHTRTIAVAMPHVQSIDKDWTEYRVSVDEVEELTGLEFFSALPPAIQDEIESVVDDEEVDE